MTERVGDLERRYVDEVLTGAFRSSAGSVMTQRLEQAFAELIGTRFAVAFINGTATMHAVLAAAGIGPGDEVVVPPLTMASTTFAVMQAGAVPVFADIDAGTFTLDPAAVEAVVTERTRAMIPVALYGLAPDLDGLAAAGRRHGLLLLEDDAQCLVGRYRGRTVGSIGDAASFSFQSSKHLTSGEGGMVTTDDEALAESTRRFGSLGYRAVAAARARITKDDIQAPDYLRHDSIGFNYRMPELCAAVALAQVQRAAELVAARQAAGAALVGAARGCEWLVAQSVPADRTHTYWTAALALHPDAEVTWTQFRKTFLDLGGEPFYGAWALSYLEPVLRGRRLADHQRQVFDTGLCPLAESLQPRLIQFKTNVDADGAAAQADILARTIDRLSG